MKIFLRGLNSCMMRKADIERYRRALVKTGHDIVDAAEDADAIMVWTCAFRQDFRDASARIMYEYCNKYSGKRIVAMGCLPDIDMEFLVRRFKGTILTWRNGERGLMSLFGMGRLGKRPLAEAPLPVTRETYNTTHPDVKTTHCDQFIKLFISEGCPFNCSYCAEIRAFPPFCSFPMDDVVRECKRLVKLTDENRVVLHGDCVGEYGYDLDNASLGRLLTHLKQAVPEIRIGLRNMHPCSMSNASAPTIFNFLAQGDIFLLEMPIQSANSRVLHEMRRNYGKIDLKGLFHDITKTGFKELETHIIAGFPSETSEEFQETVDFLLEWHPKYILVSGFMAAPGSDAAELSDQVPAAEIKRRVLDAARQLKAAGIIVNHDNCDLCQQRFEQPLVGGLFI